jgi:hypothetical protein
MLDFSTFKDRQLYGAIREDLFSSYVKRFVGEYRNHSGSSAGCEVINIASQNNVKCGDFLLSIVKRVQPTLNPEQFVKFDVEVDVKSSNNISLKSILNFEGHAFVCLNTTDINFSFVVNAYSLKFYIIKILSSLNIHSHLGSDGNLYLPSFFKSDTIPNNILEESIKHGIIWLSSGDPGFRVKPIFRNKMALNDFLVYSLDDSLDGSYGGPQPFKYQYKDPFKI